MACDPLGVERIDDGRGARLIRIDIVASSSINYYQYLLGQNAEMRNLERPCALAGCLGRREFSPRLRMMLANNSRSKNGQIIKESDRVAFTADVMIETT